MFDLKQLPKEGISAALEKAHRYRLLNEPLQAESICRDILDVDPVNQDAVVTLILALTDQFGDDRAPSVDVPRSLLDDLDDDFSKKYYAGIICERRGAAYLKRSATGSGPIIFDWLKQAMDFYEEAERVRPSGNDDPILRWNTCGRLIMKHAGVKPANGEAREPPLE